MKKPVCLSPIVALTLLAATPSAFSEDSEIAELKAMIGAMQKTIAEQNSRIASLEKQQAAKTPAASRTSGRKESAKDPGVLAPLEDGVASWQDPVASLPAGPVTGPAGAMRDADTFGDLQQAAPRVDNAPLNPELNGFIPIPGTDTLFKIGGSARLDTIVDFANNGNPNQFVPSTIPVEGEAGWDGGGRTTLHTKATRLSFELRRPVAFDDNLRVFTEYDFFDDSTSSGMRFRARHFYGQAWNFLVGQTFSAFMDVDAFPDTVDSQGPNGIANRRQPQIRYTHPVYDADQTKFNVFASIEQPESKIDTGADGFPDSASTVSRTPDGILGARWEGPLGHLQGAAVFRQLSYESDDGPDDDAFGWGASLSGSLNVFERDKLSAQITCGEGVGRYINDVSGKNLDAAFVDGQFEALPVFAAVAGYTHHWNDHWRSTISGGYVRVDAPDTLDRFTIDNTLYGSTNIMWHPTKSFRTGLEYLFGSKETIDGSEADANRLNFVIRYDLVR